MDCCREWTIVEIEEINVMVNVHKQPHTWLQENLFHVRRFRLPRVTAPNPTELGCYFQRQLSQTTGQLSTCSMKKIFTNPGLVFVKFEGLFPWTLVPELFPRSCTHEESIMIQQRKNRTATLPLLHYGNVTLPNCDITELRHYRLCTLQQLDKNATLHCSNWTLELRDIIATGRKRTCTLQLSDITARDVSTIVHHRRRHYSNATLQLLHITAMRHYRY